jgi:hypothetical protein
MYFSSTTEIKQAIIKNQNSYYSFIIYEPFMTNLIYQYPCHSNTDQWLHSLVNHRAARSPEEPIFDYIDWAKVEKTFDL